MWNNIIKLDRELFLFINNGLANSTNDLFLGGMTLVGYTFLLLPITAVYLFLIDKKKFWRNIIPLITATVIGALFVHLIKEIAERPRPLKDMELLISAGKVHIHNIFYSLRENSFPSGHTQAAFTTAAILIYINRKHAFYFILIATLIGLSRIYVGVHFPLDVLSGAAIGILSSILVIRGMNRLYSA